MAVNEKDDLDDLLSKHGRWKTLRVCAWIARFLRNAKRSKIQGENGAEKKATNREPLTTKEIIDESYFWIKRVQAKCTSEEDRLRLNLQANDKGVLECRGRIQGHYPIYLPDNSIYTEKLIEEAHNSTLHGGVSITMTKVRDNYWVPRLRRLVRRIIKRCHGCKRFQALPVASPPPGLLPKDRTQGSKPIEVIGVDYAGPFTYRANTKSKKECKAYLLLYACSLTRAIYLDVLPSLETQDFIRSFKEFIARRGRPRKVYSDNGRTFIGASKWLKVAINEEKFNDFLAKNSITWQFNLSRAPWWGGQFERLIGIVKKSLYKAIGRGFLTWYELREVFLDVEIAINNRPLSYVEEELEMPILTPNSFLSTGCNQMPEQRSYHLADKDLRKRAKYLAKCKQALWSRWTREYLRGLRERHNLKNGTRTCNLKNGEVVIIRVEEKNRNMWKLGIIEELIKGRDGVVRLAKVRAGKSYLERAIQQLYPLELCCDRVARRNTTQLDPNVPEFKPRRDAAAAAELRVKDLTQDEL